MKKILISISLICYLVLSCGVVINSHYCMNRLASTRLFESAKKVCGKCGMYNNQSGGCCHDDIKVVKLQQDQCTVSPGSYSIPSMKASFNVPSQFISASFYSFDEKDHFSDHSPPNLSAQDTYLQINVFRI